MREFKRKAMERPSMRLIRGADGRLRSANEGTAIADIWAEQKRIRLAEAIEEDKRRATKREARRAYLNRLKAKVRSAPSGFLKLGSSPRKITLQIRIPAFRRVIPAIKSIRLSRFSKKQLLIGSIAVVVAILAVSNLAFTPEKSRDKTAQDDKKGASTQVLDARSQKPLYGTLLPVGKSIESLGGWYRVSPPEKDPVFAYVDQLEGVHINVSQQPVPESFKKDLQDSVAKLAEQFNAKETITVDGLTAYVGTSDKGPQSVIFVKNDLLVLIKSANKLTNDQWAGYFGSLKP